MSEEIQKERLPEEAFGKEIMRETPSVLGWMFQLLHANIQDLKAEVRRLGERQDQVQKELLARQDQMQRELLARQDQMHKELLARQDQMQKELLGRQDQMYRDLIGRQDEIHRDLKNQVGALNSKLIALLTGMLLTLLGQIFVLLKH